MNRTKVLLLVVGALAVAAAAYWQGSFDGAIAVPPPAQLKAPTAPPARATGMDQAPATVANDAPAAAPAKDGARDTATPASKKPEALVARKETAPARPSKREARSGAVALVEHPDHAAPPSAPAPVSVTAAKEVAAAPEGADVYEAMAVLSLQQHNYAKARDEFESALSHGGKATFKLLHDHTSGNFDKKDPKATCAGELIIEANDVKFVAPEDQHRFTANWSDVRDAGGNRFFGSGIGGFHVTITADGKYRNFNLAPESRDKAEGKLILDLLRSHAREANKTR